MNVGSGTISNLQSTSSYPSSSLFSSSFPQGYDESSDISTIDDDPLVNMLDKYSSDIFEDTSDEEEDDGEDSEEDEDYDSDDDGEEPFPSSSAIATPHTITTIIFKVPKIKRKRIRKRYAAKKKLIFAPRVLRSDIRRQYCVMMINAINSGDLELYRNFFKIYGMARVGLNALFPPPPTMSITSASNKGAVKLNGVDPLACCVAATFLAMPDFNIRIDNNMEVHTRGGSEECIIKCECVLSGTYLSPKWFDTIADEVLEVFDNLDITDSDSSSNSKSDGNRCEKVLQTASNKMMPMPPAALQQIKIDMRGTVKLFVNKDRQIYFMEMLPIV